MGDSFKTDHGGGKGSRLAAALGRLDELIDWERLERSPGAGRAMRQSVEPARDLLDRLGAPDRSLRTLLVAGTKGKGSVASLVANGLQAAGEVVGLYTSPHVERVTERIRIGGREIDEDALARALEAAFAALGEAREAGTAGAEGTWFDLLTAAGVQAVAAAGASFAVLECGLGARLDSTRAVTPCLSILTNVALEHTAILGSTREAIAREKAAVATAGAPLISGLWDPRDPAVRAVREVARAAGARLIVVQGRAADSIEDENARIAAAALTALGLAVPGEGGVIGAQEWRRRSRLPGRLEAGTGGAKVILDGAHVPESLERVLRDLEGLPGLAGVPDVVFGCRSDKDVGGLLKVLRGRVDRVHCTSLGRGPDATPERILGEAQALGIDAVLSPDPEAALDMARRRAGADRWVLVTGSLHLLGRLRPLVVAPKELRP